MFERVDQVRVVKMNGTQNDFVVLDERPPRFAEYGEAARRWCDREGGVGADGLLVILPPTERGVATMRIFNANGGEAEMCGNGVRCIARYLWEEGQGSDFTVDTASGPVAVAVSERDREVVVRADLGEPKFVRRYRDVATVDALGRAWRYGEVSLGNPHVVIFVDDPDAVDLAALGSALCGHPRFAGGTNVHLAHARDARTLDVRHYERGVGLTRACGTGAAAAAVIAIDDERVTAPVSVRVPGGVLEIDWRPGSRVSLSGTAEVEFERALDVP